MLWPSVQTRADKRENVLEKGFAAQEKYVYQITGGEGVPTLTLPPPHCGRGKEGVGGGGDSGERQGKRGGGGGGEGGGGGRGLLPVRQHMDMKTFRTSALWLIGRGIFNFLTQV
jgi:hypothetical protein